MKNKKVLYIEYTYSEWFVYDEGFYFIMAQPTWSEVRGDVARRFTNLNWF